MDWSRHECMVAVSSGMTERLSKDDWIAHGLLVLGRDGPNALKVGSMAAELSISRGSFYWHFRDVADFETQVLHQWETATTDTVVQRLETDQRRDRLEQLISRAFTTRRALDRAIRSWAVSSPAVAAVAANADDRRIAYISEMLVAAGVPSSRAGERARFLYWAYLGHAMVADPHAVFLSPEGISDIVEMFER